MGVLECSDSWAWRRDDGRANGGVWVSSFMALQERLDSIHIFIYFLAEVSPWSCGVHWDEKTQVVMAKDSTSMSVEGVRNKHHADLQLPQLRGKRSRLQCNIKSFIQSANL